MRVTAFVAAASLITGCAGPRWPGVQSASSPTFAKQPSAIGTVDVLPLDLDVWTEPGYDANVDDLRSAASMRIMNAAIDVLTTHAHGIGAMIDWNGEFSGGSALGREDLRATVGALARYGQTASVHAGQLPVPFLPARLGTTTGADATLYIGGWGFVANHRESTADKVARGIAIGLIVITAVVLVAAVAGALTPSHHHSRHHEDNGDGGGRGGISRSGGRIAARIATETAVELVDAFGRSAMVVATHPEWSDDPALPHDGDSAMYLEMTLVDNYTGLALWHAHQQSPANVASPADAERAARALLASLP